MERTGAQFAALGLGALAALVVLARPPRAAPPAPASGAVAVAQAADPLPSWNDGGAGKAITDFVTRVTTPGKDFVPEPERIAVFDNDGTLWAEQPMYFQLAFAIDRVKALAPQHPEWKDKEPFKSILAGDPKAALAGGEKAAMELLAATHTGMTTDEFEKIVKDWTSTAQHPRFKRPYTECIYQPMVEVLEYLRANGFKTWIVSGGGIEFMRPWTQAAYGIPPEQVIGSSAKTKFEIRDSKPVLVKLPEVGSIDDGPGKPVNINLHIGRRPVMAFGNSDGDLQMLQWTTAGEGPRFALIVHHTDAEREWAYDRESHVGKLDKALDEAMSKGWTVVDMKKDWNTIFPAPGAAAAGAKAGTITGTVAYRQRIALPPDAVVHVRLEDVSRADAPSTLISEVRVPTGGKQVPIPFTLDYDLAKIEDSHTYHLRASILAGTEGAMLFTTTRAYPVLTRGSGREAQIMLDQVGAPPGPAPGERPPAAGAAALEGPRWKLVELNGKAAVEGEHWPVAGITFVRGQGRSIAAKTGVNSLGGTYTLAGDRLSIAPGVMTEMAGPPPLMEQEKAFIAALQRVKSYRIAGGALELLDGETVLARFEPGEP